MVERVWSARTTRAGAEKYAEYFQRVVLPELTSVAGYRGARLLQRQQETADAIEIVVATEWASLDAVHGFAGEDIDRAVVHDEAAALFRDYDRSVKHFEVMLQDRTSI
jgi:heme-degrading monooxygenase HmoA